MTGGESLVAAARRLADGLLFPESLAVDRSGRVPPTHLAALAEAGLMGIVAPSEFGGAGAGLETLRTCMRTLASGCGNTYFMWVQHHSTVGTVAGAPAPLRDRWLGRLATGAALAGVAFAHIRRPGAPAVRAEPVAGGWRIHGSAPWATSWGIAEVFSLAAVTDDGRLVWSLIEGRATEGLGVVPLDLSVMGATATVRLDFDGLFVPDAEVARIEALEDWRRTDGPKAAGPNPAIFGVIDRTLDLLVTRAPELTAALVEQRASVEERERDARNRADVDELADVRAEALLLARRATDGLVAATGGAAMDRDQHAQRLSREAGFYLVQAQSAAGRAATLRHLR